jgi:hypothetical protein
MTISAHIEPFIKENPKEDPLYRTLELSMQRLGYLVPYREQLNWTTDIDTITLGEEDDLKELQKMAAKNDNTLLFYAKLTHKTIYQHVICHPNDSGIYLPFHFDNPFYVTHKGQKVWFGSSSRLLEELKWMEIGLKAKGAEDVLSFWGNFRSAATLSVQHMSPMVLKKEAE